MLDEFKAVIADITAALNIKGVVTAVLFGSVARGDADKRSDVDLCVIIRDPKLKKQITERMLDLEKKHNKDIQLVLTDEALTGIDRQFLDSILREGVPLYGKIPPVPIQRLELEPYSIIRYDLTSLSQSEKMKVKNLLYGKKTEKVYKKKKYISERKGLIRELGGIRIGIASILVPERLSWEVKKKLTDMGVKVRRIGAWIQRA